MAVISPIQAFRIPAGSAVVPIRFRIMMRLMAKATVRSKTYSKTACPELRVRLIFKSMNDEFDPKESLGSVADSVRSRDELEARGSVSDAMRQPKRNSISLPLWGKVVVMSLLIFLGTLGYMRTHLSHQHAENVADIQEEPTDVPAPDKRKTVPDIVLTAGAGPNKKLSQYKGNVVLLSFWASWCTPCLVELPSFIDLHDKLASKGLVILPVNVDQPDVGANFVGDFWKTKKFPFPTFYDPNHESSELFKIDSLPSNFVLDKQGRLVAQGYGANDWASEPSIKFIEQLLRE
jgi:thiol-disulfide isomerase/thioredoxin